MLTRSNYHHRICRPPLDLNVSTLCEILTISIFWASSFSFVLQQLHHSSTIFKFLIMPSWPSFPKVPACFNLKIPSRPPSNSLPAPAAATSPSSKEKDVDFEDLEIFQASTGNKAFYKSSWSSFTAYPRPITLILEVKALIDSNDQESSHLKVSRKEQQHQVKVLELNTPPPFTPSQEALSSDRPFFRFEGHWHELFIACASINDWVTAASIWIFLTCKPTYFARSVVCLCDVDASILLYNITNHL